MQTTQRDKHRLATCAIFVAAIAFVTGLPSLRGGFLAGDDYHLVLNHVLVNHPSLAHAAEILTIVHRDLYQPIPLLTFSLDFAIMNALGLNPTTEGPNAGAWLFHLTNVLIHTANALLVLLVIKRLTNSSTGANAPPLRGVPAGPTTNLALPTIAAILFAIHPLAAEPIAWLNGRMMMLSAFFTLLTLITFDRWNTKPRAHTAVLTIACTFLAHMSKVSVALPVLVAIFPLARRRMPDRRWWIMWIAVSVISAFFTILNINSSSEMFVIAEGEMEGSRFLYCILALAQYFRQYLIPAGLSVWYPPPINLAWTEPAVITAIVTVALVALHTALSARRTRIGLLGMLWFIAAVFPTLPIVPARRAIGADRYVYLPMIGLAWIAAAILARLNTRRHRHVHHSLFAIRHSPSLLLLLPIALALIATSWKTQSYHRDDIAAALRNIDTNTGVPGVYKQAAWAYYRHGQYENAIQIARQDVIKHPDEMACEVYQVVGMSYFRLGQYDRALDALNNAIAADPKFGKCYSRIAQVQAHLNMNAAAIANYERAIEIMPFYNPALIPLAHLYRAEGRTEDAIRTYNAAIQNNLYEVPAHLGLAEIDIQQHRHADAVTRLQNLLDWMPENAVARTNLGVAYEALEQFPFAIVAYTRALQDDPRNAAATINLANLYTLARRYDEAAHIFDAQMPYHGTSLDFLIAHHDFALTVNRPDLTAAAFIAAYNKSPADTTLRAWTAYTLAQAADWPRAAKLLEQHPLFAFPIHSPNPAQRPPSAPGGHASSDTDPAQFRQHPDAPVFLLTTILLALHNETPDPAIAAVDHLLAIETPSPPDAHTRAIADLQRYAAANPAAPWPYYHTAQILLAQSDPTHAALALDHFTRLCPTPQCNSRAQSLTP